MCASATTVTQPSSSDSGVPAYRAAVSCGETSSHCSLSPQATTQTIDLNLAAHVVLSIPHTDGPGGSAAAFSSDDERDGDSVGQRGNAAGPHAVGSAYGSGNADTAAREPDKVREVRKSRGNKLMRPIFQFRLRERG